MKASISASRLNALLSASGQLVQLCGHHEVVAGQARRGVGGELELRATPAELDVGVMELRFGHECRARDEPERVPEVGEGELPTKLLVAFTVPFRDIGRQLRRLLFAERRRALLARLAVLSCEFAHDRESCTEGKAGATGLEPAASGVTGRRSKPI